LLVLAVAAAAAPVAARQTYHGGAELVSVYATVTDHEGRLVTDLTKDDFTVSDNGKTQQIALFSSDVQPITVIVMLDRSGSMVEHSDLVRDAAQQFVSKLIPGDKARIGSLSRDIVIRPMAFTGDHDVLNHILRYELQGPGPSPIWTAVDRSITSLLNEHGRRVVLLFSDGHDNVMRGQISTSLKDVIHRTEYDEIMVYSIGLADREPSVVYLPYGYGRGRGMQIVRRPSDKLEPPDPGLRQLADRSGGGYFELDWSKDLGATFSRVADELHRQYWLGFPPAKLDDKVHKLEVKVKRADLTVRARKTYVAAKVPVT
jgi:Ca-activated chloride channel family protein